MEHLTEAAVLALLDERGVPYELYRHDPVFTADDGRLQALPHAERICKNLFLRDDKKRAWFLVSVPADERVDLRALQASLGSRRLGFASGPDLEGTLGVPQGHVTPLALLQATRPVTFVLDGRFPDGLIGVHPMHNEATMFLPCDALVELLQEHGVEVQVISTSQ